LDWGDFSRFHPYPEVELKIRKKRSLNSLVDEVKDLIPYEKILSWTLEKMALDHDMLDFLYKMQVS